MPDYTIKEGHKRTSEDIAYTEMMAKEKVTTQKRPVSTIQCASTQRLLTMTDEELEVYHNRTIDLSKAIAQHPSEVERKITIDEFNLIEGTRRKAKNQVGMSDKSASSPERKAKAIDAYAFTPPAPMNEVQLERVTKMDSIKELTKLINSAEKEPSLYERIKNWIIKPKEESRGPRLSKEFLDEFNIKEKK